MKRTLFAKNFILLILGQASSLFGNFILKLALSMYILEITGSAAIFAGILSAATVPTILLSPFGGILADRVHHPKFKATRHRTSRKHCPHCFSLTGAYRRRNLPVRREP